MIWWLWLISYIIFSIFAFTIIIIKDGFEFADNRLGYLLEDFFLIFLLPWIIISFIVIVFDKGVRL
jgi:hypothetical protein